MAILDFLYFGEASVYQENLDSFLAIAEDLKLKGLTGQTSSELMEEQEKPSTEIPEPKEASRKSTVMLNRHVQSHVDVKEASTAVAITNQFTDLAALDQKVKSMMERSQNMIPSGKQADGTPRRKTALICKVCGKEGNPTAIRDHIEANHLEGISIPCDYCDKTFNARPI